jgi:DNA-binding MarR family transcriptional regulator
VTPVDDPEGLCVSFLVRQTWLTMRSSMDAALSEHQLSIVQYATLQVLSHAPGSSTAEIARVTASTRQAANELIGGLAERGLVERSPHPTDRRSQQLHLSAEGERLLAAAFPAVQAREALLDEALDPAVRDAARTWLRHISTHG